MNEPTHIINKVFLEVNTSSQKTAFVIKDNISSFLESELFPELERWLQKYDMQDSVIRFDQLHLDVGINKWQNTGQLKKEISALMQKKLQAALNDPGKNGFSVMQKSTGGTFVSLNRNSEAIFLHFIEHGRLPWFGRQEHISKISQDKKWSETLQNKQFVKNLDRVLSIKEFATQRFVLQFPRKMVFRFLKIRNEKLRKADIRKLEEITERFSAQKQKLFFQCLVKSVVSEKDSDSEVLLQKFRQLVSSDNEFQVELDEEIKNSLVQVLKKIQPGFSKDTDWNTLFETGKDAVGPESFHDTKDVTNPENLPNSTDETNPEYPENAGDNLYDVYERFQFEDNGRIVLEKEDELLVDNAGLILLHPFLKPFFDEFEFLDKNNQLLKNKKELAVQALHYLATGNEDFFEGNLVFCKFLCGVPLKMPVPRKSLLTKSVKEEADRLLKETIKHWPALKNTSPDGLRQMFLQRDGKLFKNEMNFKLIVERKAQDILLDKLAWNISLVKLPWSNELLYIEW